MGIPILPQAIAQVWGCFSCLSTSFPYNSSMGLQMVHPTPPTKPLKDTEFRSVGLTMNPHTCWRWDSWWDPWGCPEQGQDLDTMIFVGPFQFGIFCDSMTISCNNQPSGYIKPLTFTHPSHSPPLLRMQKTSPNPREPHPSSKLLSSLPGAIKDLPGVLWQDERCL